MCPQLSYRRSQLKYAVRSVQALIHIHWRSQGLMYVCFPKLIHATREKKNYLLHTSTTHNHEVLKGSCSWRFSVRWLDRSEHFFQLLLWLRIIFHPYPSIQNFSQRHHHQIPDLFVLSFSLRFFMLTTILLNQWCKFSSNCRNSGNLTIINHISGN